MLHSEIKIGENYQHLMDGRTWIVKIVGIFEDRQRWGWDGELTFKQSKIDAGSKCWGWCDELRELPKVPIEQEDSHD